MKYHYKCNKCGHEAHITHPMTQEFIKHCPDCQEESFNVVIGATVSICKGDGWTRHDKSGRYHPKGGT